MTAEQTEIPGRSKEEELAAAKAFCAEVAEKEGEPLSGPDFVKFIGSFSTIYWEEINSKGGLLNALGGWKLTVIELKDWSKDTILPEFRRSKEIDVKVSYYAREDALWYRHPLPEERISVCLRGGEENWSKPGHSIGHHSISILSGTGRNKMPWGITMSEQFNPLEPQQLLRDVCCGLWELYSKHMYTMPPEE